MNLYLLSQRANSGYDTFDSAVVAAPDEETARNMSPTGGKPLSEWDATTWVTQPSLVKAEYIGQADPAVTQSIICASFNAG